ncbi:hypothetical protein [Rhodospira trueperi]|uniref:Transposase, IS5 family n=1 Tax=Rhodospira trueperi TaxID=69960 RepID=A0A1G7FC94_9PROT|nr:hypothetical protein SAMN05421720_1113 [Rhodospira trueperi]
MAGQLGFFDLEDRYAPMSKARDPLEKLSSVVDFEPFRYRLVKALKRSDGAKGGRPPLSSRAADSCLNASAKNRYVLFVIVNLSAPKGA